MATVLIADDSRVIRTRVASWISREQDLDLVGQAEDGRGCIDLFRRLRPDLVVLDIEMPGLDGITTLRQIRAIDPRVPVIMFSALTESGSRMTVAAMLAGATDYVPKPLSFRVEDETRRTLVARIRSLVGRDETTPHTSRREPAVEVAQTPRVRQSPDLIAVASSTGGPAALGEFLRALGRVQPPVVIVQHMQPGFLELLVAQLAEMLSGDVAVGRNGEILAPGSIRFAPSGVHLQVHRHRGHFGLSCVEGPPVNSCRPAADILFSSVASCARRPVGVVLSGMGTDGLQGAQRIAASGGVVVAQDRATSAVWGMPGVVVEQGLARLVGSPGKLGSRVRVLAESKHPASA